MRLQSLALILFSTLLVSTATAQQLEDCTNECESALADGIGLLELLNGLAAPAAFATVLFAIWRYYADRKQARSVEEKENSWRRFRFMLDLWDKHLNDRELVPTTQSIEAGGINAAAVLQANPGDLGQADYQRRNLFDRYFERLEILVYARNRGSVEDRDLDYFMWHFGQVNGCAILRDYCEKRGYEVIVKYAQTRGWKNDDPAAGGGTPPAA